MKLFTLLLIGFIVLGHRASAQNTKNTEANVLLQITNAFLFSNGFTYNYPEEYQGYLKDYLLEGYLYLGDAQNPFNLGLDIQVIAPVKVKYSLYTFKKTFSQDGKRNYYQGIKECGLVKPLTTQEDIDNTLDKIYEFPVVTEISSGYKELSWDGYTDPKFTGQKYPVRDCLYIAAYNADTGELIDTQGTGNPAEIYQAATSPGIVYRIDEQKDGSGKVAKETLSGKVVVPYADNWPIKKITALIAPSLCGYGALSFDIINQGADAIAADINRRIPGDVSAHIALTNPTIDKNNPNIKIFDWKDIKGEDGKDFIPDLAKYPDGYYLTIIIEIDEMTFTGIKNGFITNSRLTIPPILKSYTDIKTIEKADINIASDESGFVVLCPIGILAKDYAVYDLAGRTLKTGSLSGLSRETITTTELRRGIYFVQITLNKNDKEETVTKKVIIQ